MSLWIEDYVSDLKQYINLSEYAQDIINYDIEEFSMFTHEQISYSGFLNIIFTNFYLKSNALVSERVREKEKEYLNILQENLPSSERASIKKYIDNLIKVYKQTLIKENDATPLFKGKHFYVNVENTNILRDLDDDISEAGSLAKFLKIIFEQYARLPQFKREEVFYENTISTIKKAMNEGCGIKVILNPSETIADGKKVLTRKKFHVRPYKIVQDKNWEHLYLIGLSKNVTDSNEDPDYEVFPFRITNISRVSILQSERDFISKEKRDELDELSKNPQYHIKGIIEAKVQFTDYGLSLLNRISKGRPELVKEESNNIKVYKGNSWQIFNYFWKFTTDVEIIEPTELRELFAKVSKKVSDKYNN